MKRLALLLTVLICSCAAIAAEDIPQPPQPPLPPQPQFQPEMQRLRQAQSDREQQRQHLDRRQQEMEEHRRQMQPQDQCPMRKHIRMGGHRPMCVLLMLCAVVHILAAVWVFQDIRARGAGSGIWIVIVLLAGLLGALVYAVVRLGDVKKS